MKRSYRAIALLALLSLLVPYAGAASACSWAAFTGGDASIVARTMDWYYDDGAVVKGHGRGVAVKASDTPNALEYKSKYASLQVHGFGGVVIDAMNEKGLQCAALFLDDSELPPILPERRDVGILDFIGYVVSNFATVQEAVDSLGAINIIPTTLGEKLSGGDGVPLGYKPENTPLHFAMADAGGDRAVIEFVEGKTKVYHGKEYDAMTNEPNYEVHLYLEDAGYQPNGSILPVDRRMRAKLYLRDMYERGVEDHKRALLAMRGLLATVYAGTEEVDRVENEVYPTIWAALVDQTAKAYYISRYDTWRTEYYDFSMFQPEKPEVVTLAPTATPPAVAVPK